MGREWAKTIAAWFAENGMSLPLEESVSKLIEGDEFWDYSLFAMEEQIQKNKAEGKVIGYAQEAKMKDGSAATLLLTEIVDDGRCKLRWWAVGDSCLVIIRSQKSDEAYPIPIEGSTDAKYVLDGYSVDSYPIKHAKEFSSITNLLSSNDRLNAGVSSHLKSGEIILAHGDRLYLMTDALSEWFLRALENGRMPWLEMEENISEDDFSRWINALRDSKEMKNDDVTLGRIIVIEEDDVLRAP